MKNRLGAAKRRCQQKKHRMIPRELVLGPRRDFFFLVLHKSCGSSGFSPPGVHFAPGLMCRRYAGLGGHSGRIGGIPGGGSRTRGCGSACRSRRWRRPCNGGIPRSAYRRFNQCGGGAASRSRDTVEFSTAFTGDQDETLSLEDDIIRAWQPVTNRKGIKREG